MRAILGVMLFLTFGTSLPIHKQYDSIKDKSWKKCAFSYGIHDKYHLFKNSQDFLDSKEAILKALNLWATEVKIIKLYEVHDDQQQPDIDITFALRDHNCTESFDGPGGIVAHSAYPPHGILHFDAEEVWSLDGDNLNLSYVALHELGHVLGLKHSEEPKSIMNSIYRNGPLRLSGQDIRRLRRLFAYCNRV
ncbi:unnamed protein product [Bursaphelenchus xylophilus]|uniref:(pine wood nematode) hypothetical protein n=1 Tax=Bursaphelenchus xylophilus TaxID=6326 RepID=A0A1I7SU13_BURXY|nr:unnamed protein product [Bursaphelenchus xylophilus]CAG9107701.1 unnamed protein product [Bursaphelenchus xylophilus]